MKKGFWLYLGLFALGAVLLMGGGAQAQSITIDTGTEGGLTERVLQLIAFSKARPMRCWSASPCS